MSTGCVKYFVTSLVVGTTAVLLGWIISPETAGLLWNLLPSICCLRGMTFGVLDRYLPHPTIHTTSTYTPQDSTLPSTIFTKEELKQYDGTEGSKGLYIGFFGRVYDVSKGAQHYGPGGGYSFFTACDATRAFVTGEFNEEGLIEDVEGLDPLQMLEVQNWVEFYQTDYTPVGILHGHFYDGKGQPTAALHKAEAMIQEGLKVKDKEAQDKKKYPPCNSEWKQGGGRVWCSTQSGGITRDWEGFPRRYYKPGAANWRCACVKKEDLSNAMFKLFDGCDSEATSCKT